MNASTSTASTLRRGEQLAHSHHYAEASTSISGVSWDAILAGAAGAIALSLILLILGTGLGFSSISPWSHQGASSLTMGLSTILWVTFTQLAASATGGYLAGRLRTKWEATHSGEAYFRNTTHGLLAWAVATMVTVTLLTSTIGSVVSKGAQASASVVGATASAGAAVAKSNKHALGNGMDYFVDSLFRKDISVLTGSAQPTSNKASVAASTSEVARIFSNAIRKGALSAEDTRYVAHLVAQRTGITQANAERRVTAIFDKIQATLKEAEITARESADKARKAASYAALWLSISLLFGAFCASFSAACGGRRRDM